MRELLRAVVKNKPMFALMETEAKHGGITPAEVRQQLSDNVDNGFYVKCSLAAEVAEWGYEMPSAEVMGAKLLDEEEPIEWARSASSGLPKLGLWLLCPALC